jgi:hypothetical protein
MDKTIFHFVYVSELVRLCLMQILVFGYAKEKQTIFLTANGFAILLKGSDQ